MTTVIYVDILFFINVCIDYICLYCVYKIYNLRAKQSRLLTASIFGGVYGVINLFLNYAIVHIVALAIITLIAFDIKQKKFIVKSFLYVVISATLGGFTIALINLFGNMKMIPILFVVSVLVTYIFCNLRKKNCLNILAELEIHVDNLLLQEVAFIDSGNLLKDVYTGRSVILIKKNILGPSFEVERQKGFKIIPIEYKDLKIIKCFRPDLIKIIIDRNSFEVDAIIAIDETGGSFSDKNVLIPGELIGDLL